MPEQIERPDGQWVDADTVYQSLDWGLVRGSNRVDGAGNAYTLSVFAHWNATIAYLRKTAPNGQVLGKWNVVFRGAPHTQDGSDPAWNGVGKIDDASMAPAGRHMVVVLWGHVTNQERQNPMAAALIDVGYQPSGAVQVSEDGGFPTFVGGPAGGDVEVDYERLARMMEAAAETAAARAVQALVANFGGNSVRGGIMEKDEDAMVRLFTDPKDLPKPGEPGYDPRVVDFQGKFYQYVKNANAGVWYNILNGVDNWNRARRDELKQVVREVLNEHAPGEPLG